MKVADALTDSPKSMRALVGITHLSRSSVYHQLKALEAKGEARQVEIPRDDSRNKHKPDRRWAARKGWVR